MLKSDLGNYEILMGDSRVVIPVIIGILIIGLLFASDFEQKAYARIVSSVSIISHANLNSVDFIDANNGIGVGERGMIVKTTDGGTTWTFSNPPHPNDLDPQLFSVDFIDANNTKNN